MKTTNRFIAILALTLAVCANANADIADGLVAYYPFNGNANDESGNGNDGIVNGAIPTMDRFDIPDGAYYFDGTNDFVEVMNHECLNFGHNNFSFSLWVQIDSTIDIQGGEVIVLNKAIGPIGGYFLAIRGYTEGWGRPFGNIGSDSGRYWGTNQDLRDDQWHFIALVRNGDIGKLYIDGTLDVTISGLINQSASVDKSLFIGEPDSSYGGNGEFKGKIDNVRIYNRVLTETEIQSLFLQGADFDADGYTSDIDCDDSDPFINPDAIELPGNTVDENCDGDLGDCDPCEAWKNHGEYVRCTARAVEDLVTAGYLTEDEGDVIISSSAQSEIGKKGYIPPECQ
jgi:hypothetical protein